MPAGSHVWAIRGTAGTLRAGSRVAATLTGWEAGRLPDGRWRITVTTHAPDPYWLENGSSFFAVLQMGRGTARGVAEIVSREPLVFDMENPQ